MCTNRFMCLLAKRLTYAGFSALFVLALAPSQSGAKEDFVVDASVVTALEGGPLVLSCRVTYVGEGAIDVLDFTDWSVKPPAEWARQIHLTGGGRLFSRVASAAKSTAAQRRLDIRTVAYT
jgi:hypothetical protein